MSNNEGWDNAYCDRVSWIGRGLSVTALLVLFLMFAAGMNAATALAGSSNPEAITKSYKKAKKTCRQMERDHNNMQGEHKLMFKAWQEKSISFLTEDAEVLEECRGTLSALKNISDKIDKMVADEPLRETLFKDYEETYTKIEDISIRHRALREKHERLFHEMMGH